MIKKIWNLSRTVTVASALMLVLALFASCTGTERIIRRAEASQALGEYYDAAALFKRAYQRTPTTDRESRGKLAFRMAEMYRAYGNIARAQGAFQSAARYGYTDTITLVRLAEVERQMGDYRAARQHYAEYLETFAGDETAERGIANCDYALAHRKDESAYTVRMERLFSSTRTDYAPALLPSNYDVLYFTSSRNQATGSDLSNITGIKNGDLFFSKKDERGRWKAPESVEGGVNTDYDEGTPAFTPDGSTMYLTVCTTDGQYPRMAEIWSSSRSDATWSKAERVAITADTLSSYAHPAVSPDGRWLYFASDMPGGYGDYDVWRVSLGNGKHGLGAVENLGPQINSPGRDVFPAFRPNGDLYFASDGRTPNFGGLDLYYAVEDTLTHHWSVTHLPAPMNSQGDDFGITFEGNHHNGFFSSSRSTGGRGWDKIYSFSYPEVMQTVKGWVYEQDGYELPEATVYVVGEDGTNLKMGVQMDGSFEMSLTEGVQYLYLATCPGYLNYSLELTADSLEMVHQHTLQFPLPSISLPVLVRNVFYEFDKADITPQSGEALDRLIKLLEENPNITIELSAHCDYRGADDYNLRLSQRRAEAVVQYLKNHGIAADRLTPVGYGESKPKIVNKRLTETYPFLHENDSLTEDYIKKLPEDQQEICNSLNRRTEFRVLRTTYGLFDENGRLKPEAVLEAARRKAQAKKHKEESTSFEDLDW